MGVSGAEEHAARSDPPQAIAAATTPPEPGRPLSTARPHADRYGNSPRRRVASATRSRPSATAARRSGTFSALACCQVASKARSIVSRWRLETTVGSQA